MINFEEIHEYIGQIKGRTIRQGFPHVKNILDDVDMKCSIEEDGRGITTIYSKFSGNPVVCIELEKVVRDSAVLKIIDLKRENYTFMIVPFEMPEQYEN